MKDCLNHNLEVGDEVILIKHGYRELTKGVIIGFTPKMVRISTKSHWQGKVNQYPNQIVKIIK